MSVLQIDVDPDFNQTDADSAFGSDAGSYTTSLKSSVLNYKYENGRRYHAIGNDYMFPNDESELDRLDLYHHICNLRLGGKLHLAPIGPNPERVLDIGTGTGIWAIEFADQYPSAEVIGNDLSPVQPNLIPPNLTFEVDDVEREWTASPYSYIHCRSMYGAIRDWPHLMQQVYNKTKSLGWVEFQDFDMHFYTTAGTFNAATSALHKWSRELAAGMTSIGIEAEPGPKLEGWVRDAGFINITAQVWPLPVGTWPKDSKLKEIGAFDLLHALDGLEGVSLRALTGLRGYTPEEVEVLLAQVRKELREPGLQGQHNFFTVYAQKPGDGQEAHIES